MTADGSNVGLNNKDAAGQLVPHVHVHIIPQNRRRLKIHTFHCIRQCSG
ncbi:HIT family protein [Methanococcoides burtonii]|nr:HIT domain-containing protein [Methanococcoides burtonii]